MRKEQVVLRTAGRSEDVTIVRPAIRSSQTVPCIVSIPTHLNIRLVRGEISKQDVVIHTIERKGEPAFIRGLKPEPNELLDVELFEVRSMPTHDNEAVGKTYHFQLSPRSVPRSCNHMRILLTLDTGRSQETEHQTEDRQIVVNVSVLDQIALAPNSISFQISPGVETPSRKVYVVRRDQNVTNPVSVDSHNMELLWIRSISDPAEQIEGFEIGVKQGASAPGVVTKVVFRTGPNECDHLELPIQFSFR